MLAVEPWWEMLKAGVVVVKEMAVLAYYFTLAYLLPAAVAFALLMGGIHLWLSLT
jgi:hypothetical protein